MPIGLADLFTASNQDQGTPGIQGASEGGWQAGATNLLGLFQKGADVYSSVKEANSLTKQREQSTKAAATVATNESKNNLVLYLVLGAVALVGLIFFLRR